MGLRIGDMIVDNSMLRSYEVVKHDGLEVKGRMLDNEGRKARFKTFSVDDLECIDADDGLWQETERG